MNKRILFSIIFLVLFFIVGCKSKQEFSTKRTKAKSLSHFVSLVHAAEPKFTSLSATGVQVMIDIENTRKKVSASLRMQTDSVIVFSISPFMGIELYSLELYPDKWILYDKINRQFAVESYEYLYYNFGLSLDFSLLQSLLSARLFFVDNKNVDFTKCKLITSEIGKELLQYELEDKIQSVFVTDDYKIEQIDLKHNTENIKFQVNYTDYAGKKGKAFPQIISFQLFKNEDSPLVLNLKMAKINFDSQAKIVLSRPERYSQVSLNQIVK